MGDGEEEGHGPVVVVVGEIDSFSFTDSRPFFVRVLLIPSTMLPEVFVFSWFTLPILLTKIN